MPNASVWLHIIRSHAKGTAFPSDKLFPHFWKLLGVPDQMMTELYVSIKTIKRRKYGHQTNTEMWLDFKSNQHFRIIMWRKRALSLMAIIFGLSNRRHK